MDLYIIRHGKTQWNQEKRFQGAKNSDLVSSGKEDAKALHDYLLDFPLTHAFSSPLGRAKDTAMIVLGDRDINIIYDERLAEMNFGLLEGMKIADINTLYHDVYDNLWNHPEDFERCPGGGESFFEVKQRIVSFLESLKKLPTDSQVLIVTHGMYFVNLLGYFFNYSPKDFVKINREIVRGCSLTHVTYENNQFVIDYVGDEHYLKPQLSKDSFLVK